MRRNALIAFVAVLGLSACGGSESQSPATATVAQTDATSEPSETGATPTLSETEAKALSASMNLRLTDFPAGWRAEPPDDEDSGCAGIDKLSEKYDLLAHQDSKDFADADTATASSTAGLFNDESTAREGLNYFEGAVQSDEFRKCLEDGFREAAGEEVALGDVSVGQVSFPRFGDRSSAWEIVLPVEAQGLSATAYVDAVFIVHENALATLVFSDVFSPFDEGERERLAGLVENRMQTAVKQQG
jgi:hypothetical protein